MQVPNFIPVVFIWYYIWWRTHVIVNASQAYVCTPDNSTSLTGCTSQHWIHISNELYAPRPEDTSNCNVNLTSCNSFVKNVNLAASCNGPVVSESIPCREEVDFERQRSQLQCMADAKDLGVVIEYSCIRRTQVLDMCSSSLTHSQTTPLVYLASPGFPNSGENGMACVCSIQGSKIGVEAFDVDIQANIEWEELSPKGGVDAVLTFESETNTLWNSNTHCPACQRLQLHNTDLISSHGDSVDTMNVTYSDFGLPGQNVWLQLFNLGSKIEITCSSSPLPSNRIITTPTTTAATTQPTTSSPPTTEEGTTQSAVTPTATPVPEATVKSTESTTQLSGQVTSNNLQQTSETSDRPRNRPTGRPSRGKKGGDEGHDHDTAVIVVLFLVVLVLIAILAILIVITYRWRDKLGSMNPRAALASWFDRLCPRRHHAGESDDTYDHDNEYQLQTYDNIAVVGENAEEAVASHNSVKMPAKLERRHNQEASDATGKEGGMGTWTGTGFLQKNPESALEEKSESLMDPDMYASHYHMVGEEMARMKMERSLHAKNAKKKLNEKSSEPDVHSAAKNDSHQEDLSLIRLKQVKAPNSDDLYAQIQRKPNPHDARKDLTSSNSSLSSERDSKDKKDNTPSYKKSENQDMDAKEMNTRKHTEYDNANEYKKDSEHVVDSEKDNVPGGDLKLSPEEGQMFEALGISQPPYLQADEDIALEKTSALENDGNQLHTIDLHENDYDIISSDSDENDKESPQYESVRGIHDYTTEV